MITIYNEKSMKKVWENSEKFHFRGPCELVVWSSNVSNHYYTLYPRLKPQFPRHFCSTSKTTSASPVTCQKWHMSVSKVTGVTLWVSWVLGLTVETSRRPFTFTSKRTSIVNCSAGFSSSGLMSSTNSWPSIYNDQSWLILHEISLKFLRGNFRLNHDDRKKTSDVLSINYKNHQNWETKK